MPCHSRCTAATAPRHGAAWCPGRRCRPKRTRDDDDRLKIALILTSSEPPVERALLGARIEQAAQPVAPLPLLTITETKAVDSCKQAPLLFIETQRDASSNRPGAPRLRRVFLSGSEAITLRADFHLQAKSANEAEPVWASNSKAMIRFEGNAQNLLPLIPTDVTGAGATRERLLAALDAALGPVEGSDGDDPLLAWRADGSVTTPRRRRRLDRPGSSVISRCRRAGSGRS